jgi:NADPH-dependent 2,4-dienoyl-CoA reductase/sulfur reductase-like enzyme
VRDPAHFQQQGIELAAGHRVLAVDLERGRLEAERRLPGEPAARLEPAWDRLVVASGALPRDLRIPGLSPEEAPAFKTLEDLRRLKARLAGLSRVAVAGAGPLGLELCEALRARGLEVLLVEPLSLPLAGFPRALRERVARELEVQGVVAAWGSRVTGAARRPGGWRLELAADDGSTRVEEVDLLVQAAGQRAATDFLGGRLPLLERGVLPVDLHMRSSHPRVWAAGDCAARPSCVPALPGEEERPWHPQAREALRGGRVAGWNAAGGDAERSLPPGPQTISLKCFSLEIARCGRLSTEESPASGAVPTPAARGLLGLAAAPRRDGVATVIRATAETSTLGHALPGAGRLRVWLEAVAGGRLRGGALLSEGPGAALRVNALAALLQKGGSAADLAGLDLAYSPPFGPLGDPLILAAGRLERVTEF